MFSCAEALFIWNSAADHALTETMTASHARAFVAKNAFELEKLDS